MALRFDTVPAHTLVTVRFQQWAGRSYTEQVFFLGIRGEGDDRRAGFVSTDSQGKLYDWEAYRSDGRWVYGSSAQRLTLEE